MKKLIIYKIALFVAVLSSVLPLQAQKEGCRIVRDDYHALQVELTTGKVAMEQVTLDGRAFSALSVDGLVAPSAEGMPALPLFSRLIEVPLCEGFEVTVSDMSYDTLRMKLPVMPTQPSRSKSDTAHHALVIDGKVYATDAYYGDIVAEVEAVGIARDRRLARLQFAPMRYNPVTGELVVCRRATVTVRYTASDEKATRALFERYHSPAFTVGNAVLNSLYPKSVTSALPVRYLIVAHSMFRGQLDTFVQWKRRKGFITDIVYTDEAAVGSTSTSIQTYIQNQYNNATAANPAPTYVLIVGDHEQIPAFTGTTSSSHITDLYYISWTTGDNIPDCYCGRFSAQSADELVPQVEKTLMYEQYTFADPSFLDRAVMVAGVDGGSSGDYGYTHADPAMDYAIINYINGAHGFSQVMYFKNNTSIVPAGSNVTVGTNASSNSATVRGYYNQGAGLINYSAHGSATSWGTPNFTTDHAAAMTNTQKFGLMIGNCCLTNKFQTTNCLGESVLRKGNYCGAVGYIGGSNSTYWYEDFYWAVGVRSNIGPTMSMAYDAANLGVYDRAMHTHGEANSQWAVTQGAIMFQGNMAVESSTTSRKLYYWEIYHLMGDPSVMTWLTQASVMPLSAPTAILLGSTSVAVVAVPYAYVALTSGTDHTVIAAAYADASGTALLSLPANLAMGSYELTASAQQYRTAFQNVTVISPNGPHVEVSAIAPAAPLDAGTTVPMTLTVNNLGTSTARNVVLHLSSSNAALTFACDSVAIDSIVNGTSVTLANAVSATVDFHAVDGAQVRVNVVARCQNNSDSMLSVIPVTLNAPLLRATSNQHPLALQPGDSTTLGVTLANIGHGALPTGRLTLSSPFPMLAVSGDSSSFGLPVSGSVTRSFVLHADSQLPTNIEMPLVLRFEMVDTLIVDTLYLFLGTIDMETFEGSQFSFQGWSQGTYPWVVDNTVAYGGSHSAHSTSALTHNQTAELSITRTLTQSDSVSFHYRVSSETNWDKFHFLIDGVDILTVSGEVDWTRAAFPVAAGTHTFKFTYEKDRSVNSGSDCAWIDNVVLPAVRRDVVYREDNVTVCDSLVTGGSVYTESGVLYDVLSGASVDTLHTLNLTVNHSSSDTVVVTSHSLGYTWDDSVYYESGTYIRHYVNYQGCDSMLTLLLTIDRQVVHVRDTVVACDSVEYEGRMYFASATVGDTIVGDSSDTIHTTVITVNHSSNITIAVTFQANQFTWGDSVYTESGTYSRYFVNQQGCDSIVTLQLTLISDTNTGIVTGEELSLRIYPNPTKGMVYLGETVQEVTVYDMQGRMVACENEVYSIDLGTLPQGVYLLKAMQEGRVAVRRIVKR